MNKHYIYNLMQFKKAEILSISSYTFHSKYISNVSEISNKMKSYSESKTI